MEKMEELEVEKTLELKKEKTLLYMRLYFAKNHRDDDDQDDLKNDTKLFTYSHYLCVCHLKKCSHPGLIGLLDPD